MKTFSNYERLEELTGMTLNEFMELEQPRSIELEFGMADTYQLQLGCTRCPYCGSIIGRTPKIYLYKSGCSPLAIELRPDLGETIVQCAERISKKPHYFKKIK